MLKRKALWGGLAGLLGVIVLVFVTVAAIEHHSRAAPSAAGDTTTEGQVHPRGMMRVKVVHPKLAPDTFARTVEQPAYVRAYYQASLMARAAGPVTYMQKNIGDTIHENEVLVELDVPDLIEDVVQKKALLNQAEQNVRGAQAAVVVAEAAEKQAWAAVTEKQTEVERALATRKYRWSEHQRFKQLASGPSPAVTPAVVEERLRDYEAADADWKAAQAAVEKAKAAGQEFHSKVEAAQVDIQTKQSLVAVARADLQRAEAVRDYARIRAPFNGLIVARHVDPGTFVQNASTGKPTPVLNVVRTDIVTAVMWVPEKDAPYVRRNTEAILRFDALGDQPIQARITRLSHWLDPEKSRDMRVEVDLWNASEIMKPAAFDGALAGSLAPLGAAGPAEAAVLLATRNLLHTEAGPLQPGMYGTMRLILQRFPGASLVPDGAVFERNGHTCIFEVRDGKAHLVLVEVQVDDGIQAKVVKLVPQKDPKTGQETVVKQELTGKETIIPSDQGEIADGQVVQTVPGQW
jgi:multidrug efflux pump subunit AcrA (membrane-fusion protein)